MSEESVAPPGHEPRPPAASPDPPHAPGGEQGPPVPEDTDDTRGWHFRRLIAKPLTISLGLTLAIAAFVGGTLAVGPALGAGAALGVAVLVAAIVFAIAHSRAAEDFFRFYAQTRGLQYVSGKTHLPGVTPLLRKGDARYCTHAMRGNLPGGLTGTVARYTYEEKSRDSDGNETTTTYPFTVVFAEVPESVRRLGTLLVERRSGFRFLDGAEDMFRRNERLELESEALDRRYEIFRGPDEDPNYMRQLFSPSFIVWLTEEAPEKLGFEYVGGALCVNVEGHFDEAVEFDALCEAAGAIGTRLREEALE